MSNFQLISAIGTPLRADESLHAEGLRAHLDQQWNAGIDGVLVAGSMGVMQLLTDATYEALMEAAAEPAARRGRVLVGIGDTSLARTRQRLRIVNRHRFDGAVAISPFFLRFDQKDLIHYFRTLADESAAPLYLYHVPALTHAPLEPATIAELAAHPNIAGVKCSGSVAFARQVMEKTAGRDFSVIAAHPTLTDMLFRGGVEQQLDGVYAVAPRWTAAIRDACAAGDWERAAAFQQKLSAVLDVLVRYGIFPTFTALLNAQGVPGNYAPAPLRPLDEAKLAALRGEPIVRELIEENDALPVDAAAPAERLVTAGSANGHRRSEVVSR